MHLQMAGRAFVLKASPLSLKAQWGQVYDLPNPPEHSTDTVYHGANQIEHAYVKNGDKKVNMLFSGPRSWKASGSSRMDTAMQSEDPPLGHTSNW